MDGAMERDEKVVESDDVERKVARLELRIIIDVANGNNAYKCNYGRRLKFYVRVHYLAITSSNTLD